MHMRPAGAGCLFTPGRQSAERRRCEHHIIRMDFQEMTPEQRFLVDMTGYLHLPNALSAAELSAAQEAAERYEAQIGPRPPTGGVLDPAKASFEEGFGMGSGGWERMSQDLTVLSHGFAFDPALVSPMQPPAPHPLHLPICLFAGGAGAPPGDVAHHHGVHPRPAPLHWRLADGQLARAVVPPDPRRLDA